MATTQDIHDLKAQLDERAAHLREGFGVIEADITRLSTFAHDFQLPSLDEHQHADNDLRALEKEVHDHTDHFIGTADTVAHQNTVHALQEAAHAVSDAQTKLDQHIEHHGEAHAALHDATQAFGANVEQVTGEHEQARNEYLQHVHEMHDSLSQLAEKVFGTAGQFDQSVREAQSQIIDKAAADFHGLLDGHLQSHLPEGFGNAANALTDDVHNLGQHASTAAQAAQKEIQDMIKELEEFTKKEVHDKVEQKLNKLINDVIAWLTKEIAETIATATGGVAVTGAISPILPEMAALKHALDGIKAAIDAFKALESIFG